MRQPLSCVLDIDTKDAIRAWLGCFRHSDDIYVDIDPYRIEFTTADDSGHTHSMSMPSIYLEQESRMYRIKDLLEGEE